MTPTNEQIALALDPERGVPGTKRKGVYIMTLRM